MNNGIRALILLILHYYFPRSLSLSLRLGGLGHESADFPPPRRGVKDRCWRPVEKEETAKSSARQLIEIAITFEGCRQLGNDRDNASSWYESREHV